MSKYEVDTLVDCDSFACVDVLLIRWIVGRLRAEDCLAKLDGHSIYDLCGIRAKMHFGSKFSFIYEMLDSAYWLVNNARYEAPNGCVCVKGLSDRQPLQSVLSEL